MSEFDVQKETTGVPKPRLPQTSCEIICLTYSVVLKRRHVMYLLSFTARVSGQPVSSRLAANFNLLDISGTRRGGALKAPAAAAAVVPPANGPLQDTTALASAPKGRGRGILLQMED